MPLWLRVGRRRGKRSGLLAASLLFAVAAALLALVPPGGTARSLPLVVVVGVGYAGMQMFPLAMLPDVIAADEAASGERRAGVFTGVWTAAETLGLAVGPASRRLLAVAGYVSSTGDDGRAVRDRGDRRPRRASASLPALLVAGRLPVAAPATGWRPPWTAADVSPAGRARRARPRCRPATCRRTAAPRMAYVYDSGRADLDDLAAGAQAAFQCDQRARPDRVPERRAHRERPGRRRRSACSAAARTPSAR